LLLRFWGTRGSIATPGPTTMRFGGNTSCVEVVTRAGNRFVLDCGTGARPLGAYLMAQAPKPITATILFSHTHWDHLQGFPFFAPIFVPGSKIRLCGPNSAHSSLPNVLAGQMEYTYFPVELAQLGADLEYVVLAEGAYGIGGATISTQFLNHPAITLGYKIEADGVSLLYLCDHEPYWEPIWCSDARPGRLESILHEGDGRHAKFMENADVVIHDAQYTPEEYPSKRNWGHSTYSYATQLAAAANVKRLFLTHHDPTHDDEFLVQIENRSRDIAASVGSSIRVSCAYEGYEETIESEPLDLTIRDSVPRSDTSRSRRPRILIVDDDEDLRILARKALDRGGYEVIEAAGGKGALQLIEHEMPDAVLLDLLMPPPDGFEVLRMLRSREDTRTLPVIVLTAHGDEESVRSSFELGATDFLAKPFTPPQLDARVRACCVRAAVQDSRA
jgi:CheY-like chemotaxis protein